jgi:hypothetical protein
MYKTHHPKADIDRLYVKKKEERRGLVQVEVAYEAQNILTQSTKKTSL